MYDSGDAERPGQVRKSGTRDAPLSLGFCLSLTLAEATTWRQPVATASSLDGVREARISNAGPAVAMAKAVVSPMDPGLAPVSRTVHSEMKEKFLFVSQPFSRALTVWDKLKGSESKIKRDDKQTISMINHVVARNKQVHV